MSIRSRAFVVLLPLGLTFAAGAATPARAQYTVDAPGVRQPRGPASPRVAPLPEAQWTDVHRSIVTTFAPDGRPDNGLRTLLTVPELAQGVMPYTNYLLDESSLSARDRALLVLRSAWLAGSQPIWARQALRARAAGLGDADIKRVAEGPSAGGWKPFDAVLLRLADELYVNSSVTDATWAALSAEYDLFHQLDAVETVNHFIVLSMVYNTFGVQPDEGWTDRLPTDVPYRIAVPSREAPLTKARVEPNPGQGIAVGRTFGRYAALNAKWSPRQTFILRISKLSPKYRELLILRMGWNCRSEYEWAKHVGSVGRAREHGLEPARIAEGASAAGWDALERTLIRAADELYRDGFVSDAAWQAMTAGLDTGLAMSAVFSAADYRAISMSLNTYGVQLDAPTDERLPTVPTR
ncbi:MAG: carboxymuconolactone decarboxylase family protein [Vicinamibacterales bacterium]